MTTFTLKFTTPLGRKIYRSTIVETIEQAKMMGRIYQERNYRKQWVFEGVEGGICHEIVQYKKH
jgi:hypothetical protein